MIIKELTLENFCCYYGSNTFALDKGLNVVLGHNGDGKTTIITALKWIFDPLFAVKPEALVSAKKFAELKEGDSFNVKVILQVDQYDEIITIEKGFNVTKDASGMELTPVTESSFIRNMITGENDLNQDTKRILNRIFPPEFRQFSIFEGEAGTLKLIDGASLANLVRSFSSAKTFEKLEAVSTAIKNKAEKAYVSQSKADAATQEKLANYDKQISIKESEVKTLEKNIENDESGYKYYQDDLDELSKSSELSKELNKVNEDIKKVSEAKSTSQRVLKTKYTDYLFDDFFILAGYEKFRIELSDKIDTLRQARDRALQEKFEENYEEERLSLMNGATPLPPGSPSKGHLEEALRDGICKVCNRPLDDHARTYMNKSLSIYAQQQSQAQKNAKRAIFQNDFIEELYLMDKSIDIHYFSDSYGAAKQKIKELVDFNAKRENEIRKCNAKLDELENEKKGITAQTAASEEKLQNVIKNITDITRKMHSLSGQIERNKQLLEIKKKELAEVEDSKRRMINQLQPNNFKRGSIEILYDIQKIFSNTKEREYEQYLAFLGEKATAILRKMNPGEATGVIKLIKNRNEVLISSLNEDGTSRSALDNSGALSISISMSILFAIADMASKFKDGEAYPMIFDAPTGRFSPDRKLAFYEAIYETGNQCLIVTLDFLGAKDGVPFLVKDLFESAKIHKAFWVKRTRPFDKNKKETIDSNITEL